MTYKVAPTLLCRHCAKPLDGPFCPVCDASYWRTDRRRTTLAPTHDGVDATVDLDDRHKRGQ